ncbi:hypothetical protein SRHO_G00186480 [Serrasalmus rhombeus]
MFSRKWRTLLRDLSNEVSTLQFASLCTHTVVSAAKLVIQRYRPALTESESTSLSGKSSSTDAAASSSRSSAERFSEILVAKHLYSAESQTRRRSQICDFSTGCMHVIGGIISLYQSAPFISSGQKKSTKVCPAGEMSDSGQCASSSGNQNSSQRESTGRPFRKTRRRLSRILASVRRALPNPFQCMTRP